ncbi:MAG: 5-formyltetrahydrofolate cyclo-ligase [Clostridia bacterium]|nr:5-formyltetrahydrofolate cyclo-ligase [Clostridia bacterium]
MNSDDIIFQKNLLRKSFSESRKTIKNRNEKSEQIFLRLIDEDAFKNSESIAFFKSFGAEVNTAPMISRALSLGKTALLPRVCKDEMKFYKYTCGLPLEKSTFGVEEPPDNKSLLAQNNEIDLIIVPGLCFDKAKNRLGYGGGFYDRFLTQNPIENIALCFDEQIYEEGFLPAGETDVKVGKIITDKRIIL